MILKNVGIIGYGVTTKPLVQFLRDRGIFNYIYDDRMQESLNLAFLDLAGFVDNLPNLDCVITSPGIPPSHPIIKNVQSSQIPLFSEYDFFEKIACGAFENIPGFLKPLEIWISGTNGKTTTTQMLEFLLAKHGGVCGGNIGTPLATLYNQLEMAKKEALWILETSSFMLHYTHLALPKIYILLPVFEDHITWHGSFDAYVHDKLSILSRLDSTHIAIIPSALSDHPLCLETKARVYYYSCAQDLNKSFDLKLEISAFKEPFLLDAALALSALKLLFEEDGVEELNNFRIAAHRLEEFFDSKGRLWVDDSKGTNVDASIAAILRYQDKPKIHLILGGDDKGANLQPLFKNAATLKDRIRIYGIGSNADRLGMLAEEFDLQYSQCLELEVAVNRIKSVLQNDEVALLSPAAASLDQFSSYKERGEKFRTLALS